MVQASGNQHLQQHVDTFPKKTRNQKHPPNHNKNTGSYDTRVVSKMRDQILVCNLYGCPSTLPIPRCCSRRIPGSREQTTLLPPLLGAQDWGRRGARLRGFPDSTAGLEVHANPPTPLIMYLSKCRYVCMPIICICTQKCILASPNYPLRHPKYHLMETTRLLIELPWGV